MPEEHPEIRRLTIQEVCARLTNGNPIFLLDVRRAPDSTQIKGACYWPPLDLLAADRIKLPVSSDALIIPYCDEPQERLSAQVARKLLDLGYEHVHPLLGGYLTWKRRRKGYPIEPRPGARAATTQTYPQTFPSLT